MSIHRTGVQGIVWHGRRKLDANVKQLIALLLCYVAVHPQAQAQTPFQSGIALTNDRVWRGLSETRGQPAAIGEIKWVWDNGPLIGFWASNAADDRYSGHAHLLPFAGYEWTSGKFNVEVAYQRHIRPGAHSLDFGEITTSLGVSGQRVSLRVGVFVSPDFYASGSSQYEYIDGSVKLVKLSTYQFGAFAHMGASQFSRAGIGDYGDWKIGLRTRRGRWSASAALTGANPRPGSPLFGSAYAGTRFAVTVNYAP
jgi:uncharacterized protein (TIGR02001 family)